MPANCWSAKRRNFLRWTRQLLDPVFPRRREPQSGLPPSREHIMGRTANTSAGTEYSSSAFAMAAALRPIASIMKCSTRSARWPLSSPETSDRRSPSASHCGPAAPSASSPTAVESIVRKGQLAASRSSTSRAHQVAADLVARIDQRDQPRVPSLGPHIGDQPREHTPIVQSQLAPDQIGRRMPLMPSQIGVIRASRKNWAAPVSSISPCLHAPAADRCTCKPISVPCALASEVSRSSRSCAPASPIAARSTRQLAA